MNRRGFLAHLTGAVGAIVAVGATRALAQAPDGPVDPVACPSIAPAQIGPEPRNPPPDFIPRGFAPTVYGQGLSVGDVIAFEPDGQHYMVDTIAVYYRPGSDIESQIVTLVPPIPERAAPWRLYVSHSMIVKSIDEMTYAEYSAWRRQRG